MEAKQSEERIRFEAKESVLDFVCVMFNTLK